ncbi:hypothetical protein KUA08_02880 [Komagataeibacter melomenusus]|uniref:hypothetical protein n=1 Tax=Komagataeibacter melomenusus TaxID=2766578 RepID=UPI001C2D885C|nr:hypothetical protein [Komagataeibacter melomenusus]MBV1829568.1 hypothetical protein [Komagataeibacter melomenusus]
MSLNNSIASSAANASNREFHKNESSAASIINVDFVNTAIPVPETKTWRKKKPKVRKSSVAHDLAEKGHEQESRDSHGHETVTCTDGITVSIDPETGEILSDNDIPDNRSASEEYGEYADEYDVVPDAFRALIQKIGNKRYRTTLELLAPFYQIELIRKAFRDAGYSGIVKNKIMIDALIMENPLSCDEQEHVLHEISDIVKTMHREIAIPYSSQDKRIEFGTDRAIMMACMSFRELRKFGRKLGGKRLKNKANRVRTNIRRIISFHGADPVQDAYEADEADDLDSKVTAIDDNGNAVYTRLDSREYKKSKAAIRDKTITDCLDDSCVTELGLTSIMFVGTLPGEYHGATAIEKANAEIRRRFNRIKAMLSSRNVALYGTYTWELHEDETPHLQSLLYCDDADIDAVIDMCRRYFPAPVACDDDERDNDGDHDVKSRGGAKGYTKKTMCSGGGGHDDRKPQERGFIGLRRNIKPVFDLVYCCKLEQRHKVNAYDLSDERIMKTHEMMKKRQNRSKWLFLINGFKNDDLNREYDYLLNDDAPDADDMIDHINDNRGSDNDADDAADDMEQEPASAMLNAFPEIEIKHETQKTYVIINGEIAGECSHPMGLVPSVSLKMVGGKVVPAFNFNTIPDPQKHTFPTPSAFSPEGPENCGKIEKNETQIKRRQDRTRAYESDQHDPDDSPDPTPAPASLPGWRRGRPHIRRNPGTEARTVLPAETPAGDHMKTNEGAVRSRKPALFKIDGMMMTRDEMHEYRLTHKH